jgi:hypothetical protein
MGPGLRQLLRGDPRRPRRLAGPILSYERLGEPEYLAEILDFLHVRPRDAPLHTVTARQSHDLLRTAIANYDELSVVLAGTELEAGLRG